MFEPIENAESPGLELVELVQKVSQGSGPWTLLSYSPNLSFIHDRTFQLVVFKVEKIHDKALPPKGHEDAETE